MTTLPPDPGVPDIDDSEAAVHAVFDGEATPEQRRIVARDPELRARLEEVRGVAAAVGATPDAPPESTLDALRARALGALDSDAGDETIDADVAPGSRARDEDAGDDHRDDASDPVVHLAPRRRIRLPPLPAVAAVVVVLLALGLGLILGDRGKGDQRAGGDRVAASNNRTEAGEGQEQTNAGAASADESQSDAPAAGNDAYASFDDDDALRKALQTVDTATLSTLAPKDQTSKSSGSEALDFAAEDAQTNEVQRCSRVLEAFDPSFQPVQAAATVVVDGQRLLVLSNERRATQQHRGSTRLTVVQPLDCLVLFAVDR